LRRLGLVATACVFLVLGASLGEPGVADSDHDLPQRSLSDRYRAFAMRETQKLATRTCRSIPRRALFKAFSTVDDPGDDNYIALGYAKRVDISPIPLQRAAYDGCRRGLRRAN
jgi:hypothetical protein